MMPPERFPPDDPREWLNRAKSNLAMAKNRAPGIYSEGLCFGHNVWQRRVNQMEALATIRNVAEMTPNASCSMIL